MRAARPLITAIAACWLSTAASAQQQGMGGMDGMGGMGMGGMGGGAPQMHMGPGGMHMQVPGMPPMHMGPGGGCMMMGQGPMMGMGGMGGMSGMGGMGMGGMGMGGMGGMMMPPPIEQRLMMTKMQLGITDAQAAAWDSYAKAATAHSNVHKTNHEAMMKAMQTGNAAERMDAQIKNMEAMVAALKDLKPATEALIAVLNDQQKQLANSLLSAHCTM